MMLPVIATSLFFPIYLWVRSPFHRLPLHYDTGFYVSNHTVATGRLRFKDGWNARFAGCSKVLPEAFYSLVYLWWVRTASCRPVTDIYKHKARLAASVFNYLTAICVGCAAAQVCGSMSYYYAGLLVYGLLSSEPQYGVYYECGEWFGLPASVLSLILLLAGMSQNSPTLVFLAATLWAMESGFVKLSSAVGFAVLFGATVVHDPRYGLAAGGGGAVVAMLFALWVKSNGRTADSFFHPLAGHEGAYGQRAQWSVIYGRVFEKLSCLLRTFKRQPVFPALALVGAVVSPPGAVVWWYGLAVFLAYMVQAADCWYYQIPLLPFIALLATGVARAGPDGYWLLLCGAVIWLVHNQWRSRVRDVEQLTRWSWGGHRPWNEINRNIALERAAGVIAPIVRDRSLLVYGPLNQAYVMLSTSYDTPIVSPDSHLDEMSPTWQQDLNERLRNSPPAYVLDTGRCFDAASARDGLGLNYRIRRVVEGFGLYELTAVEGPVSEETEIKTHRPQSDEALEKEGATIPGGAPGRISADQRLPGDGVDAQGAQLAALLDELSIAGFRRIAAYGAGRFTVRHADIYRRARVSIACVLDDRKERIGDRFLDWPLRALSDITAAEIEAIVLSTDRFTSVLRARVRRELGSSMPSFACGDAVGLQPSDGVPAIAQAVADAL